MRIVIALGGNALLRQGESADAVSQRKNVELAAEGLAAIAANHDLVITHGNGPQVGLLALQNAAYEEVTPYPLDVLDAESEGMIGYMLELALRNAMPGRDLLTVLTEVIVDEKDPAFAAPSKAIGPVYSRREAERLTAERGWSFRIDGSEGQRLVASPKPQAIVELRSLRTLIDAGAIVICAGGGGIPVALDGDGAFRGVEAVVDKDLTASLLARRVDADLLVMLTNVDAVYAGWGTDAESKLGEVTPEELRSYEFEAGSMGPKVEAARRFTEATSRRAAIGELRDAVAIVRGEAGTQVAPRAA